MGNGDYLKDNTGQTVMTGLNEEMCRQVAQAGGGAYIHVENNSRAQEQLDAELDKLSKKEIASTIYSDFDEQFQAVGIIALLLLIIEICILDKRTLLNLSIQIIKDCHLKLVDVNLLLRRIRIVDNTHRTVIHSFVKILSINLQHGACC